VTTPEQAVPPLIMPATRSMNRQHRRAVTARGKVNRPVDGLGQVRACGQSGVNGPHVALEGQPDHSRCEN
jgi:hypothetical protein